MWRSKFRTGTALLCLIAVILDSQTAMLNIRMGIELCLTALIPSIFPFLILTAILTGESGKSGTIGKWLCKITGSPMGSQSLLIAGILGGYPVGAGNVSEWHQSGRLRTESAQRLLMFANNAGPAFIFGVLSNFFPDIRLLFYLWIIHIFSAGCVAVFLPHDRETVQPASNSGSEGISRIVRRSAVTMATICAWVLVMRLVIGFLDRWFFWAVPEQMRVLLIGLLDLSNGCYSLGMITDSGMRFIVATAILSFGSLCVWLQTGAVTQNLNLKSFYIGKMLHCLISTLISVALLPLLPCQTQMVTPGISAFAGVILLLCGSAGIFLKRNSSFYKYLRV